MWFQMVVLFEDFVEKRRIFPLFFPYSAPKISLFVFILSIWQAHQIQHQTIAVPD